MATATLTNAAVSVDDRKWCVYEHVSPSGKRYIGLTCNPKRRWAKGSQYKESPGFALAIKKYGWSSFKSSILFSGLTEDEAYVIEAELIEKYQTTDRKFGYNTARGGSDTGIRFAHAFFRTEEGKIILRSNGKRASEFLANTEKGKAIRKANGRAVGLAYGRENGKKNIKKANEFFRTDEGKALRSANGKKVGPLTIAQARAVLNTPEAKARLKPLKSKYIKLRNSDSVYQMRCQYGKCHRVLDAIDGEVTKESYTEARNGIRKNYPSYETYLRYIQNEEFHSMRG